ncbi:MAG: hypothetical protein R3212_01875, partial [Xanthomonadales bacterium]|nr:hypothetical protein [Xanthomonadales bacterium]
GYVRIKLNPVLYSCTSLASLLDARDDGEPGPFGPARPDVGGIVELEDNLPGCNGAGQVLEAAGLQIDMILNGAWMRPGILGQGLFVSALPDSGRMFMGWMTFDRFRPVPGVPAVLGDPGHRWLTGLGAYVGNRATLVLYSTRGGLFDAASVLPQSAVAGEALLEFSAADTATLSYDLPASGLHGVIPLRRIQAGPGSSKLGSLTP